MPYVSKPTPIIKSVTKFSSTQFQISLTLPIAHFTSDPDAEEGLANRVAEILAKRIRFRFPDLTNVARSHP